MRKLLLLVIIEALILSSVVIAAQNLTNESDNVNDLSTKDDNPLSNITKTDWGKYINGALGFAFGLAAWFSKLIEFIVIKLGAGQPFAGFTAFIATTILFVVIVYSLARGSAKVFKVGFKYILVIIIAVFIISFIYGLMTGGLHI